MQEYILEMNNITKEFSGVKALDNVNLKVKKGEIHALCGENGAGKSTLMNVLSAVYPYGTYSGQILYNGKELQMKTIKDSEDAGIAIIHQELALVKELSVSENMFLGDKPNKHGIVNFDEMYDRTQKLLKSLELDINPYTLVKNLGVGQQQLVEIAKALSKKANLIIFDEPTAALTENEVAILTKIIKNLKKNGVTCIYISHKLNEVMDIADSVTILRDGKTIATKDINDVTEGDVIKMMVGREMKDLFPKEEHQVGDVIFEARNITAYSEANSKRKVVDNVSFKLRKGEILGIAGLIGAGRTELVSSIFGTYEGKHNGDVFLNDKKLNIHGSSDSIKAGITMVPEDRKKNGIIGNMSVKNNISLSNLPNYKCKFNSLNENQEVTDVEKYIKELRIKTPNIGSYVKNLSGGNQQKVVLAKNLLIQPQILILDEPTRGIDIGAKNEIYKLMYKLVKNGISIIMVSSELPEILGMSDRVLVMSEGIVTGEFENKGLTQEKIMECEIRNVK